MKPCAFKDGGCPYILKSKVDGVISHFCLQPNMAKCPRKKEARQ